MSGDFLDGIRESAQAQHDAWKAAADPDCKLCRGRGTTTGWVAQGYVTYPCSWCVEKWPAGGRLKP